MGSSIRECKWKALCKCLRWITCCNPLKEGIKNHKHQHIWMCGQYTFYRSRKVLGPTLVTNTVDPDLAKPNKSTKAYYANVHFKNLNRKRRRTAAILKKVA